MSNHSIHMYSSKQGTQKSSLLPGIQILPFYLNRHIISLNPPLLSFFRFFDYNSAFLNKRLCHFLAFLKNKLYFNTLPLAEHFIYGKWIFKHCSKYPFFHFYIKEILLKVSIQNQLIKIKSFLKENFILSENREPNLEKA